MKYIIVILLVLFFVSCKKADNQSSGQNKQDSAVTENKIAENKDFQIEFIELGSVNCIPCKKMQPIMKSIENKYKGLVKVTFYDVWKEHSRQKEFGIDLIPTQVFRDAQGKELLRHQGFFPEEQIDAFLKSQGISPVQ